MSGIRLVLASQSPRRAALLHGLGLEFDIVPADIDERYRPDETPAAHVERLAQEKAWAVGSEQTDAVVIGADTVVVVDGDVLGKPRSAADAVGMLLRLQGRNHDVYTGIAIARGARVQAAVERAVVRFRPFDAATAAEYVGTGEPMDKAGAYGIQGMGATLVERIEGDFFAIMGLPLMRMILLLQQAGLHYNFRGLIRPEESHR